MRRLSAFACGLVFALGLGLAGMTQPAKVLGFLDFAGDWDPTLMFVMGGAVLVGLALFPPILARQRPWLGGRFALPDKSEVDARLVVGAVVFLVSVNIAVRTGGLVILIIVPVLLVVLIALLAMITLAFLANGYFIGATSVLMSRKAMPAPESLPEMQSS